MIEKELPFKPYLQQHKDYARHNRTHPTYTEKVVRKTILSERPLGYKFTRQKSLGPYIADFYCSKLLLVIEIDGDSHNAEYDLCRDNYLEDLQIKTIRYTNDEVMSNGNKVAEHIEQEIRIREKELGYNSSQ